MKSIRNVLAGSLLAGGALLVAATGISVASAADDTTTPPAPGAQGPGPHGFGPGRLYSKLGLTTEQQASIKAIWTAAKPQMQSLHAQAKANHKLLASTTPDDPNYATVIAQVAQTNATLASQRTSQSAEVKAQIYALLTPTQKTQLAALQAQWAANPHHGHWGPHAPGAGAAPAPATAPAT